MSVTITTTQRKVFESVIGHSFEEFLLEDCCVSSVSLVAGVKCLGHEGYLFNKQPVKSKKGGWDSNDRCEYRETSFTGILEDGSVLASPEPKELESDRSSHWKFWTVKEGVTLAKGWNLPRAEKIRFVIEVETDYQGIYQTVTVHSFYDEVNQKIFKVTAHLDELKKLAEERDGGLSLLSVADKLL